MQYQKIPLPIDAYLDEILHKVEKSSTLLIKASPGSGKTTRLPWFIAKKTQKKVVVLEPRRLAAKLAAERIAFEENLKIGQEVGYHFRFDKKLTHETKLIFYTEGTFLKRALHEKDLADIDIVILDEFHERHLETDMALAYLLDLQSRRKDLKLILMSATLDTEITRQLLSSTIIEIEAPRFPVEIHYLPNQPSILNQSLEQKVKGAIEKIPPDFDVLVFLPGMREILKVQNYLAQHFGKTFILHSEVSQEEQEEALKEYRERKIILSTNIAESSVTIPGVRAVIDSGIQREAHYSPWNGLKLIQDGPITKSSAIQRMGRAGRTAPGICHRLYAQMDYEARADHTIAEILKADLTDTYLMSAQFGPRLSWITPPPAERWQKAHDLCFLMGIVDNKGCPLPLASQASNYPVDLRLSRVLLAGEKLTKDLKRHLIHYISKEIEDDTSGILARRLSFYLDHPGAEKFAWEKCLLSGFIDQVSRYRLKQNDFIHYSGKTIKLHPSLGTLTEGYYLVLDITQRQEAIMILPIEEEWLFEHEPFPFISEEQISIEPSMSLKSLTKLGSIVIDEKTIPLDWATLNEEQKQKTLQAGERFFSKHWQQWKESESYNRYHYWHKLQKIELPAPATLKDFLDFSGELKWNLLDDFFKDFLKEHELNISLPRTIQLGEKKELTIHYPFNLDPFIEAPIQDFYGIKETPKIGPVTLTLKLLGPHKRPLQVTKDLPGFWEKTYKEMKKELSREYPRHYWPDDPARAIPVLLKRHLEN